MILDTLRFSHGGNLFLRNKISNHAPFSHPAFFLVRSVYRFLVNTSRVAQDVPSMEITFHPDAMMEFDPVVNNFLGNPNIPSREPTACPYQEE